MHLLGHLLRHHHNHHGRLLRPYPSAYSVPHEVIYYNNKEQLKGSSLASCDTPARFEDKQLACYDGYDREGVMITGLQRENQFAVIFLTFMLKDSDDEFESKIKSM